MSSKKNGELTKMEKSEMNYLLNQNEKWVFCAICELKGKTSLQNISPRCDHEAYDCVENSWLSISSEKSLSVNIIEF